MPFGTDHKSLRLYTVKTDQMPLSQNIPQAVHVHDLERLNTFFTSGLGENSAVKFIPRTGGYVVCPAVLLPLVVENETFAPVNNPTLPANK